MPLTTAGYDAPRAADLLVSLRAAYESRLAAAGLPSDVEWTRDTFLGLFSEAVAVTLGDLAEGVQALYDALDPNNATGVQLDNLCALVGVYRQPATYSTVDLTLGGTPATVIPAGALVEDTAGQRWATDASATIGGGGTVVAAATAVDVGEVVATSGTITTPVTLTSGWSTVTNATAASAGQATETDAALRLRRTSSLADSGGRSAAAIRAALLALDFVEAAVVLDNTADDVATIDGITLAGHSVAVILYPDTLTTAQEESVALLLYDRVTPGAYMNGSDAVVVVTGDDGSTVTMRWDYANEIPVDVDVTVDLATGYVLADVETAIEALVTAYFEGLAVGGDARILQLYAAIATVEGVDGATVTLDGGGDVTASSAQRLIEGTTAVHE